MITPRPSWHHLLTWRRVLLVLAACAMLGVLIGCGSSLLGRPATPPPPDPPKAETPARSAPVETPAPDGETAEAALVRTLRDQLANAEGAVADIKAKLSRAEDSKAKADAEAALAPVRSVITWVTWIGALACFAGAALQFALFFWSLPVGRGTAWILIIGGPVVACLAQGFGLALPWLPLAGLVVLVGGALVLAFLALRKWAHGHQVESFWYQATAAALGRLDPAERERIDGMALSDQKARGVLAINDRALFGKPKKKTTQGASHAPA